MKLVTHDNRGGSGILTLHRLLPGTEPRRSSDSSVLSLAFQNRGEDEQRQDNHEDGERLVATGVCLFCDSHDLLISTGDVYIPFRTTVCRPVALGTLVPRIRLSAVWRGQASKEFRTHRNCFTSMAPYVSMDDIDPDTVMIIAGVVLSLVAALEFYPNWKNARKLSATDD